MNRVILMGRLTRDPEVRYSQGERSMQLPGTPLQWTEEAAEARIVQSSRRISSIALHLTARRNLRRNISVRVCVSLCPEEYRQVAM